MPENRTIGRYEVTAELGRGSMGVVHRAHDPVMDRDVAIKMILLPFGIEAGVREEYRERFLREAQAAGRLSHPGIVTVYDFNQGPGEDPPFIAMEYVEGPTLHELICAEGALSPQWALGMADTLAGALATAHEAGVIHRDLKPANILVRSTDGVAKIADFGVARVNQATAGAMYGSPSYFAPECIRGHAADMRSDLFALAVILFEALTGERPFGGKDYDTICHAITHDEPTPARRYCPDLSPAFDRFFRRALAKDPDERFQDATAFREAIRSLQEEQSRFDSGASTMIVPAPAPLAKPRAATARDAEARARLIRRWRILGPASLLLVLLSFAAGWSMRSARPPDARTDGRRGTPHAFRMPDEIPTLRQTLPAATAPPLRTDTEITRATTERDVPRPASGSTSRPARPPKPVAPPPTEAPAPTVAKTVPVEPRAAKTPPEPEPEPTVAASVEPAHLGLHVRSSVRSGTLTVLVDGVEAWTLDLESQSGGFSRVFRKAVGKADQLVEARIEVPQGRHTITVRAFSAAKSKEFEDSLDLEFDAGASRELTVVAGRTFGKRLSLESD